MESGGLNDSIKNTAIEPCALLFLLAVPPAAAEARGIDEDRAWDYSSWNLSTCPAAN